MKIALGPFNIDHPFILAPMAGITHSPFRRLMRRHRSSLVISELISANGIEYASERTLALMKFHEEERRIGIQIFGDTTEALVRGAKAVETSGADFVDLNLGCPVPKIVKHGAGAAMCRNPIELGKILQAMVQAVRIPVTIKIRTGWDELSINAHEVVRAAADAGVAWVAVHGRTRAQGYSGSADWDLIGEIKAKASIPIIGNGDIHTPEQALSRWKTYGVDAVLIGRAALKNPFIFEQAESLYLGRPYLVPTPERFVGFLTDKRVLLDETFNARGALLHSRKFLAWYATGYPFCKEFRSRVFQIEDPTEMWQTAREFFERNSTQRDQGSLSEPFLMGGHG